VKLFVHWGEQTWEFEVDRDGEHVVVDCGREKHRLRFDDLKSQVRSVLVDRRKIEFGWSREGERYQILLDGIPYDFRLKDAWGERVESMKKATAAHPAGQTEIRAPIPGMIARVMVRVGDAVRKGQPMLTLNAMKMENEIASPRDGKILELPAREGRTVDRDDPLAVIGE
jgi:biotin carboxyl carrier protein